MAMPDQPVEVATLVEYQAGAVVSNTLIKGAGSTVTVFAFDASEELSEHSTPFEALLHVVDGRAEVTIAGVEHTVSAGQMIRLPANIPHAVRAPERFKMMLVMSK